MKTAFLVLPDSVTHDKAQECLKKCEDKGYKVFCLLTSSLDGPIHQIECLRIVDKTNMVILYNSVQDINFTHKIDIIRNKTYLKNNGISVETLDEGFVDIKKLTASLGPSEKMYLKEAPTSANILIYDDGSHDAEGVWVKDALTRLREYCKSKSYVIEEEFVFTASMRDKSELAKFSLIESIATDDIDCIVTLDRYGFYNVIDGSFKKILLDYHCDIEYLDEIDRCSTLLKEGSESVNDSNMAYRLINSAFTLMRKAIVVAKLDKVDSTITNEDLQDAADQIKDVLTSQDIKVEGFVIVDSDGLTINDSSRILRIISNTGIDYIYICQLPSISLKKSFSPKDILSIIDIDATIGPKRIYNNVIDNIAEVIEKWTFWTPKVAEAIISSDYKVADTIIVKVPEGVFDIPDFKIVIEVSKTTMIPGVVDYSVYVESSATDTRFLIYKGTESQRNIRCYANEHFIDLVARNKEAINQIKGFEDYLKFIES